MAGPPGPAGPKGDPAPRPVVHRAGQNTVVSTTSTSYVNLPDMEKTIQVQAESVFTLSGHVAITNGVNAPNAKLYLRLLIDDQPVVNHAFWIELPAYACTSCDHIIVPIQFSGTFQPGTRRVQVQWASDHGTTIASRSRTMYLTVY